MRDHYAPERYALIWVREFLHKDLTEVGIYGVDEVRLTWSLVRLHG